MKLYSTHVQLEFYITLTHKYFNSNYHKAIELYVGHSSFRHFQSTSFDSKIYGTFEAGMPQTIYCVQWVIFLISSLQWQVTSVKQMSMANNHFKVGAHTWAPLLDIKKDERGDDTISGPFGDYLRYIMEARNCTFTIVTPPDGKWGNCNGSENCTGVIGLVARREVDFAINPFTMTLDRKEGVDFTRPVQSSAYTVVMPVKTKPKRWFFINPFPANLWILYISTIPIYFLAMVLVYYLCHWSVEWEATGSFVLRVALIEHSSPTNDLGRMFQQKLLIIILNLCFMVLTYSYAGNLTAMFTKPKLQGPIRSLNELLDQNAVPWVLEAGSFLETLMSTAPPNSTTKKIQERSKRMSLIVSSSGCYSDELEKSLEFGAICALEDFKTLSNKVFSEIGKCKFYAVKERFLNTRNALAIQVRTMVPFSTWMVSIKPKTLPLRKRAHIWKT